MKHDRNEFAHDGSIRLSFDGYLEEALAVSAHNLSGTDADRSRLALGDHTPCSRRLIPAGNELSPRTSKVAALLRKWSGERIRTSARLPRRQCSTRLSIPHRIRSKASRDSPRHKGCVRDQAPSHRPSAAILSAMLVNSRRAAHRGPGRLARLDALPFAEGDGSNSGGGGAG